MEEEIKKKTPAKGCLGIIAATVLSICVVIAGVYYYSKTYGMSRAEKAMSMYLEQKYHKKFIVTNGKYIWATGTYTFDASPVDDPEFKFPAFSGSRFYKNGFGDMYGLAKNSRETELLIKPYVDAISVNNFFSAACDPAAKEDPEKKMLADTRGNMLTPEQMLAKYPGKIYISTHISYALDITYQNKEEIFKKVFALAEFLKQKGFGDISIVIYFFPPDSDTGKAITNKSYTESKPGWTKGMNYSLAIGTKTLPDIKKWQDIENYFQKWDAKNKRWIKDKTSTQLQNNKEEEKEIGK